jgi:hypothetical protein
VQALLVVATLVLAGASAAQAAPIFSISNATGQTLGNPPFTLGFEFTASSAFTATDLGLFDADGNGLAESHLVGLWNAGGTLLATTVVPGGVAGTLVNGFRYVAIAPVLLTPGTYRVGALYLSGVEPLIFPGAATGFATIAGITFAASRFVDGGVLADPTVSASNEPSYFGPNVNVVAAVPEPFTLMLVGSGLATAIVRRRRV